jgi:anthranilate synthase component 2
VKKILVLDNYDSFTYNLVHLIGKVSDYPLCVFRNDKISLDQVNDFDLIVLSPGPGIPSQAGIMPGLIKRYAAVKRILGVCLGHQAIAEAFGGSISNMSEVYHGVATPVKVIVKDERLFKNIPDTFMAGRYHSWIVNNPVPEPLQITAVDEFNQVMGIRHKEFDVRGVQFHPESVLSEFGEELMKNWLHL